MENQQSRRSINELIQDFLLQKEKLSEQRDFLGIKAADGFERGLAEEFDQILDFSPTCSQEAVALVDFLLSSLNMLDFGSTLPDQINAKILEVVASDYGSTQITKV